MIHKISGNLFFDNVIYLSLILIPINIVHELLHGVVYRVFGGKLKYDFNGMRFRIFAHGYWVPNSTEKVLLLINLLFVCSI